MSGFADFLETGVLADPELKGSKAYKAASSLISFIGADTPSLDSDPEAAVADWLISLRVRDFALSTAFSYLKAISGLYSKAVGEGAATPAEPFAALKARLRNDEDCWNFGLTRRDFDALRNLTKAISHKEKDVSPEADITLFSLLSGAIPVAEAACLKKSDLPSGDENITLLAKRQLGTSSRQYIFPLGQGKTTPARFLRNTDGRIADFFSTHNLRWFGNADETLRSYWAYAAVLMGVPPRTAAAVAGTAPAGLRILSLFPARQPDPALRAATAPLAARMFTDNPPRWYAMHLRRRTTITDLNRKFEQLAPQLRKPEIFYPCEEMGRRIGKKIVFQEKPFIRDIVFFRTRVTDIAPMFYQIGDLAWCLTVGGKGTPYAAISQKSFETFQAAVGRFAPGHAAQGAHSPLLGAGDEVMIIGGPCHDSRGTVLRIERDDPDGIVSYLISVCNELTDKFTASVDARQLRRLSPRGTAS